MCFSAQASFIGAGIIGAIGIASVIKAKKPLRLLAVTPFLFAIQQALEGMVWLTLDSGDTSSFHKVGIYGFVIFAYIVWPLWVPFVLYKTEESKERKKFLGINIVIGCFVALISALSLIFLGQKIELEGHHIHYTFALDPLSYIPNSFLLFIQYLIFYLYLLPTVGSFFISSLRYARILGVVLIVSWLVSAVVYSLAFASVWCFFGAFGSIIIYYMVKAS